MLQWSPELDLGVAAMDADHRRLVSMVGQLSERASTASMGEIAERLADFSLEALRHFDREEALMRETGYPEMAAHIHEHRRLAVEFDLMAEEADLPTLLDSVVPWLVDHIGGMDRRFADFVLGRGG